MGRTYYKSSKNFDDGNTSGSSGKPARHANGRKTGGMRTINKYVEEDYDDFDMSKLIVRTPIPHDQYYQAVREMYSIAFHPLYILRQLRFLLSLRKRDWQFLFTYGFRAIRRVRQHIFNLTRHEGSSGT
jgi:hypothetical protein